MSKENKTKEAVLGKLWVALNKREGDPEMHLYLSPDEIDMVHNAMDEWAEIKSRERAIAMCQWATHNDWTYLPSKDCWVNEEYEERDTRLTNDQFFNLFIQQTESNE